MSSWVIVGAGYTGSRVAARLRADGHDVVETHRSASTDRATLDIVEPPCATLDLAAGTDRRFPGATIVCCAPPGADPAREMANLVALGGRRLVYVSSTGVYAPGGGAWVDESWPLAPVTASGRARLAAEQALPGGDTALPGGDMALPGGDTALPADDTALSGGVAILRVAGIHGPGRGLVERIRAGTYRIVGDGTAHVSRIHVDDLALAIVRAGTSDASGAFNIADDDPAPIGEVADAVAAHFHLPPPPRVPASSVAAEVAGMLTADRRIANGRMKRDLGVVLHYPSWRTLLG